MDYQQDPDSIAGLDEEAPPARTEDTKDPYENPKDRLGAKKPPLHLIPAVALLHESMAMRDGGIRYGPFNWRGNRVVASIYVAAAERHTKAWWDGEEFTRDTRVHHLGAARACYGILLDAQATGNLKDDRPSGGSFARVMEELEAFIVMDSEARDWADAEVAENGGDYKVVLAEKRDALLVERGLEPWASLIATDMEAGIVSGEDVYRARDMLTVSQNWPRATSRDFEEAGPVGPVPTSYDAGGGP